MKRIWAVIFVLAAIGANSPLEWVPLITGIALIVAAGLTGLSLRFSGFGRWFLDRLWPGQFANGKQRRMATILVLALLLSYLLWGTGTVLESLAGRSHLMEHIDSTLMVLGLLGAGGILFGQVVWRAEGHETVHY
jgi:hypothetical protein